MSQPTPVTTQQHHQRELIDLQRVVRAEGARRNPCEIGMNPGYLRGVQSHELTDQLGYR